MIELKIYNKQAELEKTCSMPFVPWSVTRYCAKLVKPDHTFVNEVHNEDPMQLYEDLVIKLFEGQVDENLFKDYIVEGKEVIRIGKIIFESVKNDETKN